MSSGVEAGVCGCWRRGRVGAVAGWVELEGCGSSATWAQMSRGCAGGGVHCSSRLGPTEDPPFVTVYSEIPPLGECGRDDGSSEVPVERPAPRHLGAPDRARFCDSARQEFARCPGHGHAQDVASPLKEATVVVGVEGVELELGEWALGGDAVADGAGCIGLSCLREE